MMRGRDRRIGRLRRAIAECPVQRHLLRDAYEWFTGFGELPGDDDHVAYEVVLQALRGGEEQDLGDATAVVNRGRKAEVARDRREAVAAHGWPPSVRVHLFDEALFADPPIRRIARAAITVEVAYGGDVEGCAFGARHGLPTYGSVAMHVLGHPQRWALPPFEFQAKRLFVRFDNIRSRVNQDDPGWFAAQCRAVTTFKQTGELPEDDLHFEATLANVELDQLMAHQKGADVTEAMALCNRVAWRDGEEQQDALRKLCAMAAAGKL